MEAPLVVEAAVPAPRRDVSRPALAVTFILCAAFYLWTADAFHRPWVERGGGPYFALLADAFAHGQTSLLVKPRPEMLTLRHPYDPAENDPYRLHDATFYHGKYYLYWGVGPTLLWYLPIRVLTGLSASDAGACSMFAILGLLFNVLLLYEIRQDYFPDSSTAVVVLTALLIAFGDAVPYVLRRSITYESAILCGYLTTAAFLYFVYRAAFRGELKPGYLLASGVALALSFLCRPFMAACGVSTVAGIFLYGRPASRPDFASGWSAARPLALAFGPGAVAICAQAWYNFVRFDSPFEFGLKYQLSSKVISGFFGLSRIPFGALTYLFTIPTVAPFFPFIKATTDPRMPLQLLAGILVKHIDAYAGVEAVAGFIVCIPLFVLYFLGPFFLKDRKTPSYLRVFFLATLSGALIVFLFDLASYYTTMRYEVDFLPEFLLPLATLALWLDRRIWLFRFILPVPVLYTVLVSFFLSVTGASDSLLHNHPGQYNVLTKVFGPIEKRLAGPEWTSFGGLRAKIGPPKCESKLGDPLVATGIPGEGDVFSFQCTANPSELLIAWDHHWVGRRTLGDPFHVAPGQPMEIGIETPALYPRMPAIAEIVFGPGAWDNIPKSCVVRVNGTAVFRKDSCEMDQSSAKTIYVLKNGIGIPGVASSYSGEVLSAERVPPR